MALARHHAAARPDALGFCYIDGHTRAYFGTRDVQKMPVARLKFPGPATEETWITDSAGDPLLVVMAQPSSSLASQIRDLLPQLRDLAGEDREVTLCFDRGGWSPDLFADIIDARFGLLTYRKNKAGKDARPARGRIHHGQLHRRRRPRAPLRPRRHYRGADHQPGHAQGARAEPAADHPPQAWPRRH